MKKLGILLTFLLATTTVFSQTRTAFLEAAEKSFDEKDYYSALSYYQTALEFDAEQIDILFKAAQSARLFNAYSLAEMYYESVVDLEQNGEYPLASFYLAEMQQRQGKYDDAVANYQLYLTENSGDNVYFTNQSQARIDNCNWAKSNSLDSMEFIDVMHLGEEVNTIYSEFGPFVVEDSLYYGSLRFEDKLTPKSPTRLWAKGLRSINGQEGETLDSTINVDKTHTGHIIFNDDQTRMYFTLCEYKSVGELRCDLYYRDLDNGSWSEPVALPFNDSTYTTTQPSLGIDPMGNGEAIYFTSDRPGSKKLDIWYATINEEEFGAPMNLMEINTEENDITPFFHHKSNVLYFSSEGYQSFGGFDVYAAYFNNGTELTVANLGSPINSSFNDIYYYLAEDEENGYMVSNREDAFYIDEDKEACCNDIYKVKITVVEIDLIAETYDKISREEVLGATVELYEISGNDLTLVETQSLENAYQYTIPLTRNRSYLLVGQKNGYGPDSVYFNTRNISNTETITRKLFLMPQDLALDLFVFDDETKEALKGATVSIKDLSNATTETVVQVNEDDNKFTTALERETSYQVITSKKGYRKDTMVISTVNIPDTRIVRNVYLKRGGLPDFLPLQVFFDNDQPEEKSWRRTTNKTYAETYPAYYAKKEEYKELFTEPLRGQAKIEAEDDIDRFFDNEVMVGKTDLDRFIEILEEELVKGEKIELVIQGFASPRASAAYNLRLSLRRISSLLNQVNEYSAGVLRTYIRNGQLKITDEAVGEEQAPIYVSDAIEDTRNSVYSVPASRERRVEIIEVKRF